MGATPAKPPDLDRPIVKFRWLKRICWAVAVLVVVLACVRWGWGVYAHRKLQAEIDRIRAAGEPILLEDFATRDIPDADNAAIPLTEAAKIVDALGVLPDQLDDKRFFEAHTRIKALIRDAQSRRDCAWPLVRPVVSGVDLAGVFLTYEQPRAYMRLGSCLAEAARRQHQAGHDAAAAGTIGDMLFVARRLEAPPACLWGWVLANVVRANATKSIQDLTPSLHIVGGETEAGIRPATQDQIETLIAELLDEGPTVAYFAAAMRSERMQPAEAGRAVSKRWSVGPDLIGVPCESEALQRAAGFAVKPAFVLDCVRAMEKADAVARAAMAPSFPDAHAALEQRSWVPSGLNRTNEFYSFLSDGGWRRSLDRRFHAAARNRMAAAALAMRLYELDHGRPPAKLDDLVPDYLPQLPADPFAADGRPIAYESKAVVRSYNLGDRRAGTLTTAILGPPHPVLYSVGPDGRVGRRAGRPFSYSPDRSEVVVFRLDEYRPPPSSSGRDGRASFSGGSGRKR